MSDTLAAVLHPFAKMLLAPPGSRRGVMLRARPGPALDAAWRDRLVCEASFKPDHDSLAAAGFEVTRRLDVDGYDIGLVLLSKHKAQSLADIGRVWDLVGPGGTIVCAGRLDTGGASIARLVASVVEGVESASKHHCRIFWFRRGEVAPAILRDWATAGALREVPATGFVSCPGLHSWDHIDRGSELLAAHLPPDLGGRLADLGAGWGYLSVELLRRCPGISSLDLFEAEGAALDAAQVNLERLQPKITPRYHWHDVREGVGTAQFDAIVMNPPFHDGKDTDPALGQAFIAAAAEALVLGGRLLMVANRQLPYEGVLAQRFRRHRLMAETGLFKVIEAVR
jgi:16S rRNA (guanine1207-N2)-methyltransferase